MIRFLIPILFFVTITMAQTQENENFIEEDGGSSVDCLILKDENSIICKFETVRSVKDQTIIAQWIDPNGEVSRSREMIVPAGHGSIYDYRYIKGRILGVWTFKIILENQEYTTQFELK
ncbi:hypothetical protein [Arcobacter sp. YIC-80]|uniref:hypothetical protein n=1 Tax=unclassified Arcobacter TaxID=2593671 RepID=UPI00384DE235